MPIARRSRLRDSLIQSHVGIVTIVVMMFWALDSAFMAVWSLLRRAGEWLITAIAIFDIPYSTVTLVDRWMLLISASYLYTAVSTFAAAVIVSHWMFAVGPLRSLSACQGKLRCRRNNV